MLIRDQVKNFAKKLIEDRPDEATLQASVWQKKPMIVRFKDDGIVPNNPRLPFARLPQRGKVSPGIRSCRHDRLPFRNQRLETLLA
jgi:hypothetical protein